MFDFLFKRGAKTAPVTAVIVTPEAVPAMQSARAAALATAQALRDDETASVRFLIDCDFADARLIAAQAVVSQPALQQVLQAMRNTDRRVAKLMQSRLDALQHQQQQTERAQRQIATAAGLQNAPQLLPNQVAELDRAWSALTAVPEILSQEFTNIRTALADRLAAQAALQRAVIDLLAELRALPTQALQLSLDMLHARLTEATQLLAQYRQADESLAVPKQLFSHCAQALQQVHAQLGAIEQQQIARDACVGRLLQWEAAEPATLQVASLQRDWHAMPTPQRDETLLRERFDQLIQRVIDSQPAIGPLASVAKSSASEKALEFTAALQALQQALAQGALQPASQADKRLREADLAGLPLSAAQSAQLAQSRAELARLQGWARWGGNVSREELHKAAAALPTQNCSLTDLAKKIGSLRAQWKSLDRSAGAAPHELWQSFDAACTTAYAPVAAHFQSMAEQRQKNTALAMISSEKLRSIPVEESLSCRNTLQTNWIP